MTLWLVRGDKHGEQQAQALEKSFAYIMFNQVPDLTGADSRDAVKDLLRQAYPEAAESRHANHAGQLFAFAHRIKEGDLVVMPLRHVPKLAIGTVDGPYSHRSDLEGVHHTRKVNWVRDDVPRTAVGQDLLYSFGAFMTVCRVKRNNAEERILAVMKGGRDPGVQVQLGDDTGADEEAVGPTQVDLEQLARDQLHSHLAVNFTGHELTRLVEAVLEAEGYTTQRAAPGPDGGVDILAARGPLGFESPRIVVQVKSGDSPVDVTVLRALQGSMASFKADQGLLVSWGGFKSTVEKEARLSYFSVRLWCDMDIIDAVLRSYERLPEDLRSELPLKRIWTLVPDEDA